MNDLLKKLVDIDKKAQATDEEIRLKKENLDADIQQETEAIRTKYMDEAKKKVEAETESIKRNAEIQWTENVKNYEETRLKLEKEFNDNFDKWVNSIVADVIS